MRKDIHKEAKRAIRLSRYDFYVAHTSRWYHLMSPEGGISANLIAYVLGEPDATAKPGEGDNFLGFAVMSTKEFLTSAAIFTPFMTFDEAVAELKRAADLIGVQPNG